MYQDPETRARVAEQRAKEVEEKAQKLALLVKQEREKWLNVIIVLLSTASLKYQKFNI